MTNQPNPMQLLHWKLEEFEQSPPPLASEATRTSILKFITDNDDLLTRLGDAIEFKKTDNVITFPAIPKIRRTHITVKRLFNHDGTPAQNDDRATEQVRMNNLIRERKIVDHINRIEHTFYQLNLPINRAPKP